MNKAEIAEARAACEKATPGPWEFYDGKAFGPNRNILMSGAHMRHTDECQSCRDVTFAVVAHTALPAALDALEEAEANSVDEHFEMHGVRCSNCDTEILARLNGKPYKCLSGGEESGDLALCGACMGKEFYELDAKFGEKNAELARKEAEIAGWKKRLDEKESFINASEDELAELNQEAAERHETIRSMSRSPTRGAVREPDLACGGRAAAEGAGADCAR